MFKFVKTTDLSQTGSGSKVAQCDNGKLDDSFGGSAGTLATLDGSALVVQDPANATATPTASKIVKAGAGGTIDSDWLASTGTGDVVRKTSPTITTPILTSPAKTGGTQSTQENYTTGNAAGQSAINLGNSVTEGTHVKVIDETLSLASLGAKFKAMTTPIPSGAVILSVQANIETLVVAGGTTVKIALGLHGGDVDKYGITGSLVKNQKINTVPDWAVLSGAEQIDVNGVLTDGSDLGGTNISAGSVRVRVVYLQLASLTDAA